MKISTMSAMVMVMLLSGCAEVSFKRGAGVDQLRADRKTCAASDDANACLIAKGWSTLDLGSDAESPAVAEITPTESAAKTEIAVASTPTSIAGAPTVVAAPAPKKDPRDVSNMKATPKALPKDPNALVMVSSWWKPGGANPQAAIDACVMTLGEAHKPDYARNKVTAGLVGCMRKSGWFGV